MLTASKRTIRNALKFGTTREVNSQEGGARAEGCHLAPPNCSEVGTPQIELDGAVGEVLILQPFPEHMRTKLIFNVRIDDPFLD